MLKLQPLNSFWRWLICVILYGSLLIFFPLICLVYFFQLWAEVLQNLLWFDANISSSAGHELFSLVTYPDTPFWPCTLLLSNQFNLHVMAMLTMLPMFPSVLLIPATQLLSTPNPWTETVIFSGIYTTHISMVAESGKHHGRTATSRRKVVGTKEKLRKVCRNFETWGNY